uniref:glycosyltransferase family 2 protein n=1 Tax=Acetatifactor sp. TaxID=1872090 RepID=UPI004057303A
MKRKVGVIIPSYNQGKFVEAAICSVLANKKHADIAVAVMDGGSKDETKSIIMKYEDRLDAWCSEPDGGQANAINKGIQALPDCMYYMWLNSDDVFEDEYAVAKILAYAEENDFDVCYGLSHFIDEQGNIIGEYPVEEFSRAKLEERCFLSQPSVMFSARAYEKTGIINESLKMCLDYEYWIRLAQEYEFGLIKEYIGSTRMYGETKTATMQQQHLKEGIYILTQYYGRVPMTWVVTKVLADRPKSILQYVPRRILMVLLYPFRNKIILKSLEGNIYA